MALVRNLLALLPAFGRLRCGARPGRMQRGTRPDGGQVSWPPGRGGRGRFDLRRALARERRDDTSEVTIDDLSRFASTFSDRAGADVMSQPGGERMAHRQVGAGAPLPKP